MKISECVAKRQKRQFASFSVGQGNSFYPREETKRSIPALFLWPFGAFTVLNQI